VRQWTIKNLRDVDWPALGLLVTAFALPLLSIRHVGFFPILTFPIFIASLEKIFPRLSDKQISFVAFLFLGTLISAGIVRATQTPAINAMILPTGATQFIKDNNLQGPMFDDASFGGYLIWHLWPQQRVFIDGRDDVFAGKTVDDYLTIMRTSTGWESLVNQTYNINYFILWYRPPLDGIVANLTARLEYQLGFKLVYWDDVAIILARDNAQNKTIVNNFAYTYINPFVPAANIPSKYRAAAAQEWLRAVNASPSSKILQSYLRP
jgi:hypothetical protein